MLIYSNERFICPEVNMMIIRAKDNLGYYYVHRGLYDQSVILNDLFGTDPLDLCELITGRRELREDVAAFVSTVPSPINILGCFLLLVPETVEDVLDRVGAIHVMSGPINFRKLVQTPAEVRSEISFSLSISEEYQLSWDRFFKEAIPYTTDFYLPTKASPMNGTATMLADEKSGLVLTQEEQEEEMDPEAMLFEALMDDSDDPFGLDDADEEDMESEEVEVTVAVEEEIKEHVTDEEEPVEEVVVEVKPVTGLDVIRGLI